MKKRFLLVLCSFFCVITLALGIGLSQANSRWEAVEAESTQTFAMDEGASFRLMWTTGKCGIIFRGQISNSLLETVNPQLLIVPQEYIDAIRSIATYASAKEILDGGDYIEALKEANLPYKVATPYEVKIDETTSYLLGGIKTIQKSNMNKPMFGVLFYEQNGDRIYASLPYGQEKFVSRSAVYLASGLYATNTEFVTGDAMATEMTDYFMTNGLQEAVNRTLYKQEKQNGTYTGKYTDYVADYDLSSIVYTGDKNTTVSASNITSTVYDDYLENFGLKVQVNEDEFAVGKNLDFYVDVTEFDNNYFNEQSTKGVKYESNMAGTTNLTVALGKDTSTISATISPYDITKATITTPTTQINYIEQIQVSGVNLTEKYDSSAYTPTYTLNVPATVSEGGKVLTDKAITLNNESGSWNYSNMPTSGDASGITATFTGGGRLTGSKTSSSFDIKQNVYTIQIDYVYADGEVDANDQPLQGETVASSKIVTGVYNTPYKVFSPLKNGYYSDNACISGSMGAESTTQSVKYTATDMTGTATVESIATPTNLVHYYRDEFGTDTVASDADHYEGNEINHYDYSATYNVVSSASAVGSSTDLTGVVKATNIYYETYVRVTSTSTLYNTDLGAYDPWTKLGVQFTSFSNPDNKIMFFIDISENSTTIDGSCTGTGLYKSSAISGVVDTNGNPTPGYPELGWDGEKDVEAPRPNSTNFLNNYIKLAVSKVGSTFTMFIDDIQVGVPQEITELAGECFFGLMSFCVPYVSTQSSYKLGATSTYSTANLSGDVDVTKPTVHYYRDDHTNANNAEGDDYYEGTEISETECSATYTVVNDSSVTNLNTSMSGAVSATNVYFETYIKMNNQTYNGELCSKLGIQFMSTKNTEYKVMFYIDVTYNTQDVSGTRKLTGLYKKAAFNGSSDQYVGLGVNESWVTSSSKTNYVENYIKLTVSKTGSSFIFFIDDVKVGETQVIPELAGACYFGLMGYNIGYTTKDSAYKILDTIDGRDGSSLRFATMSEDTFYYEAKIKATARTDESDDYTKIGILLTNPANSWQYFFYLNTSTGRDTHYVGVVDIEMQAGIPKYYYWYRARTMMMPTLNTWNTENVLSVYKTGNRCVFMINGVPVLERDDIASFVGAGCQIGIKSFKVAATVSDVKYTVNPTTLAQLNKERGILADDITIDGDLTNDWSTYEKSTYYGDSADDGSGRGFKVYAKKGQSGIYVAMEIKSSYYVMQSLEDYSNSSTNAEVQGDKLRENWSNSFNFEFRVSEEYYSCNCPSCQDEEAKMGDSNKDGVFTSREVYRAANVIGVAGNLRNFCFKTELVDGYYNTVVEFIVPYESLGIDRTVDSVKMLFAVRTGLQNDSYEKLNSLDTVGWWTGASHCHLTSGANYPFVIKDRIAWVK